MKSNTLKKSKKKYNEPVLKQFGLVRKITQKNTELFALDHGDQHHRS